MVTENDKSQAATVKLPPSASRTQRHRGIRRNMLTAVISLILTAVIVITIVMVISPARVVSQRAQMISSESLRAQAETYLQQITVSTARENDLILDRANTRCTGYCQFDQDNLPKLWRDGRLRTRHVLVFRRTYVPG